MNSKDLKLAIVGLGYVGLPLAVEFGRKRSVIGFDIDQSRVDELQNGLDRTRETTEGELVQAKQLTFTSDVNALKDANCFIVTVPTPIDEYKKPNLRPLLSASETVGSLLKPGDIVIYESTVYPGATEEDCVSVLERHSGLKYNQDFFCGYSPERVNPGDKAHRVTTIRKVTSGSTNEVADVIDDLYAEIVVAGTFKASSIKVAEAAKVIENTQRDLNIALINELAVIFDKLDIDTEAVLEAAATKWNFMPFRPGLVGGHCIGVDPYYLTHKSEAVGYVPEVILAGRRINDGMSAFVASKLIKTMINRSLPVQNSNILLMGLTFKENCPDIRNTKIIDLYHELQSYGCNVAVHDPWVDPSEVKEKYGIELIGSPEPAQYEAVVIAVAHEQFQTLGGEYMRSRCMPEGIVYDLKWVINTEHSDIRL